MLDIPILFDIDDDIEHVIDLPDTENYSVPDEDGEKHYFDIGIKHGQFTLFFLPIVNYGEKEYVYYYDNGFFSNYSFKTIPNEELSDLKQKYNLPDDPKLPFWDEWGGKIVLLLIILLFILGAKFYNKGS